MKKVEIHLYEVTPAEMRELPIGTQVLCYDAVEKKYVLQTITKEDKQAEYVLKESVCEMLGIHFFIFDLPKGYKAG